MRRIAVLVLASALLLTGCAAQTRIARSQTPTPTDVSNGTTVAQWASVVAEQKSNFMKWETPWNANQCEVNLTLTCGVETLTGSFVSKTVDISLKIPLTPTATSGYLATTPPKEIRSLYADTQVAADQFQAATDAWVTTCNTAPTAAGCDVLLFKISESAGVLDAKFQAWSPYLG